MKKQITLACAIALTPLLASANIIPTGIGITGTGPYVWTYNLQLSQDQDISSGAPPNTNPVPHENLGFAGFLTLYDFAGYVDGSCTAPSGWLCHVQNVGYTPDDVMPVDLANVVNLTWAYETGPAITGQPSGVDLGMFSATSIYNEIRMVSYSARGIKNIGSQTGTISDNVGNAQGPMAPTDLPEPIALAGIGALLSLMVGRRRKAIAV